MNRSVTPPSGILFSGVCRCSSTMSPSTWRLTNGCALFSQLLALQHKRRRPPPTLAGVNAPRPRRFLTRLAGVSLTPRYRSNARSTRTKVMGECHGKSARGGAFVVVRTGRRERPPDRRCVGPPSLSPPYRPARSSRRASIAHPAPEYPGETPRFHSSMIGSADAQEFMPYLARNSQLKAPPTIWPTSA